ncbi:MAG TPA: molecular chaperone HtpG [Flavilitoribacter sp.]|nr:molecular chaperone HtpG [Flavilitoribacter sp.]
MQKGTISVQTENIFPIIKKFLYSDHEIFLRELVSNAVDATTKLKTLSSKGEVKGDLGDLTIEVSVDKDAKTITISDKGIGMSEEEVKKYLNQVAFSSASEFLDKYKDEANIIGHFGLGFYSAFMVASKVEVVTKSYREDAPAVVWECEGDPSYGISDSDKTARGTDVILHIADDSAEFLEKDRIENLLRKYCRFLPVAIKFGTRKETEYEEAEGEEDARSKEVEVDNIINNTNPIWKKQATELKDEDYKQFYEELYPYSQAPMFWIHLNIDYPFNLTGVLYFPKLGNSFEIQRNKIQLYSNQVYVTDDVKEIVPEFLTLLHGVIDSPDIPLNVSRSYLQSDSNVKKITSYITRKVADRLQELFKNNREEYESKWNDLAVFVKYGMITDEKFFEKAEKFALFKSVDGKLATFEEYRERIKPLQTDKNDRTIFIYTNSPKDHDSLIKACKTKGYDVLVLDTIIDNHFIQQLEYKEEKISFIRVDAETVDQLVQKDEQTESVLGEKEQEKVKSLFEKVAKDPGNMIVLKPLSPEDAPVAITRSEFMRRMKEMQALQGSGMDGFPDSVTVVVNTNHPLVAGKLLKAKGEEAKEDLAKYLYRLALLNHNMLKGEELTEFIQKTIAMVK